MERNLNSNFLPAIVPGAFTGVYTGKVIGASPSVASSLSLAPTPFKKVLENVSNTMKNNKPLFHVSQQVQNISNYLPFTALVGAEVGPYGLIFANSVMRLCQYYKKTSPAPRFM